MAEARQEPQAHQPQPEPVLTTAEEQAHALPHQSLVKSSPLQAPPEEKSQGAQGQVWLAAQVTTPTSDANEFDHDHDHARAKTPLRSPDNAATSLDIAHEHKQEQDRKQDQDRVQGREWEQEQTQQGNEYQSSQLLTTQPTVAADSDCISTPTSTPKETTETTLPVTTVAAHQATNGLSTDQQQQHQPPPQRESTASPEDMSNTNPHHNQGPPRQPSYPTHPNQAAYATSSMATAHYGYASPGGQGPDVYRTGANVPNNAMALPSMRTFDPVQQQTQQQQQLAMAMSVNPVSSVPTMSGQQHMAYFGQQSVPMTANNPYAIPADALRPQYALPPGGQVLGGRHKKEIKRRTKTGCLTCRKRRIKCDEQHPTCKNCQKSKRECLGYDPIFKNQQQQQPTNIRPAPNNPSTSASASVTSTRPPTSTAATAPVSALASGATHTHTHTQTPYTGLPPVIPNSVAGAGASSNTSYTGNLTVTNTGTAASTAKNEPLNYSPTADPSLENVLPSTSTSHFPTIKPIAMTPNPAHHTPYTSYTPHLRGGGPSFISSSSSVSQPTQSSYPPRTLAYTGFTANTMRVRQLVSMSGVVPPALDSPLTNEKMAEVKDLYDQVYAPGLEKFFETEWYIRPQGVNALVSNIAINEMLAGFLQSMVKTDPNDVAGMQYSANLEFQVVWDLASLVYTAAEHRPSLVDQLPPSEDGSEARNRVAVFETLLSGEYLDQNPLHPPPANADNRIYRIREYKFWYSLAEFLRLRDHPNLDIPRQREYILGQMRELLDGRENRDVLYSLAIIRALAPNFPPDFESSLPPHLDESDPKNKLAVARKFIQDESQVTGGTTNVVRRFAELAVRAFISPGSNIIRQ